jgi:hypothetical protein
MDPFRMGYHRESACPHERESSVSHARDSCVCVLAAKDIIEQREDIALRQKQNVLHVMIFPAGTFPTHMHRHPAGRGIVRYIHGNHPSNETPPLSFFHLTSCTSREEDSCLESVEDR